MSTDELTRRLETVLRRTAASLLRAEEALENERAANHEPIAIVSMACRLPAGVDSPESYWSFLEQGGDGIERFPPRYHEESIYDPDPDAPGKCYVRECGSIRDIASFDAVFFGISPREAQSMDPQQRLVLETAWEALERAGMRPSELNESATGVYLGAMNSDYYGGEDLALLDGYVATGTAACVVSGRLSYVLGLQGPAMTIDTACSSSLVALHLACSALRRGECDVALAGGVTVMNTPRYYIEFSRLRVLSPTSRCRSFSSDADGAIWSEGCGILVLKRLSDARRDGDRVLALVRGSAVNQDGRSQGLSAPNGPAQQRVIRDALARSRLNPSEIDALEAHGTGTPLGDPIEAGALASIFGPERDPARPLYLGSVKSNIGHAQAAAGVASVMKMVLALQHEKLPKTLHAAVPSPHIAWEGSGLALLQETRPWPRGERVRRAGVSGFGISGTNAHLVLEEAPAEPARSEGSVERSLPLLVSGQTEGAVRENAARCAAWLRAHPEQRWQDVVVTAAQRRGHLEERAAILARDASEAVQGLEALAEGRILPNVSRGRASPKGKAVFVFPGQGSQWSGMAEQLLRESEAFAQAVDACDAALRPLTGWSMKALLRGDEDASLPPFERVDVVQPALFTMGVALAEVWRSLGVEPGAVVGHSQGEIVAAVVSGALSLSDGAKVVARRSQALRALTGRGAMLVIERPVEEVRGFIAPYGDALAVAVVNTATSTVVAGETTAVDTLMERLSGQDLFVRKVNVDYASHTAQMDELLPSIRAGLKDITPCPPRIPFYSTVLGGLLDEGQRLDADYWCRNLRHTVRLDQALAQLRADGLRAFVEVSPHPVLAMPLTGACEEDGVVVGSLQREHGYLGELYKSLGALHAHGYDVDWKRALAGLNGVLVGLPPYAFQRQRYWLAPVKGSQNASALGLSPVKHPLLVAAAPLADDEGCLFTGRLSLSEQPWLRDHGVYGTLLFPGAGTVEVALCAARELGARRLSELTLSQPLVFGGEPVQIQLSVSAPDAQGTRSFSLYSRAEEEGTGWVQNATGLLDQDGEEPDREGFESLRAWPIDSWQPVELEGLYETLRSKGLEYGPGFQGLTQVWRSERAAYARVVLPESVKDAEAFGIHPALLDAALHTLLVSLPHAQVQTVLLPFAWSDVELFATGARELRVKVQASYEAGTGQATASLWLADGAGEPVLYVGGLLARAAHPEQLRAKSTRNVRDLYRLEFQAVPVSDGPEEKISQCVVGGSGALATALQVESHMDFAALRAALDKGVAVPQRIIVDASSRAVEPPELAHAAYATTTAALELVQTWLTDERLASTEIVWVTRGAVDTGVDGDTDDLARAPLWGLLRSVRSEQPGRSVRLLDLDGYATERGELDKALSLSSEPELVLRSGKLLGARLVSAEARSSDFVEVPAEGGWRLEMTEKGRFDTFCAAPLPPSSEQLGPHEVRVQVRAAGVNFRDALNALGMVNAPELGLECAGVALGVGSEVRHLRAGDRVMGLCLGSFGTEVRADAHMFVCIPDNLSFEQAATIPLAYLTALHAFEDLGKVKPREKVLVHAAAGGVGMAAVQLARHMGAEVYGTASPGKWSALREQGLDDAHIASSRDTSFAQKWRADGIDVVLNALAREFIDASLRLLRPGGRFLEMGKVDLRDPAQLAQTHPGVAYLPFDLSETGRTRVLQMLLHVADLLARGAITPLRFTSHDVRRAPAVLRYMAQGRHVGKLVLTMPRVLAADGTVLVTGGTGELGSAVCEYLVRERGVRHLLLTSRRGLEAPGARALVETLRSAGAQSVEVAACDVASRTQLQAVLSGVPAARPLTAVLHLSGVLDDGLVATQTPERLWAVMAPKVQGAVHLHELTAGLDLSAFVLFSSAAASFGSPGQSNYAAANAFLDALAAHRKRRGLAGLSLAWGLWEQSGVGMTAHLSKADLARMQRQGVGALSVAQGQKLLHTAWDRPEACALPVRLDLKRVQRLIGEGTPVPALMRGLLRPNLRRASGTRAGADALRQRLVPLSETERLRVLTEMIQSEVALVLGLSGPGAVDAQRELQKFGLDSLMAVELRNRLTAQIGSTLPTTMAFDHPTCAGIAQAILRTKFKDLAGSVSAEAELEVTRRDIDAFAEILQRATPQQLRASGLLSGLFKLRAELAAQAPEPTVEDDVLLADRQQLMSYLESRLEAEA